MSLRTRISSIINKFRDNGMLKSIRVELERAVQEPDVPALGRIADHNHRLEGPICCESMKSQLEYQCDQHNAVPFECPDIVIGISTSQFYEGCYYLIARNAEYTIDFCPWCGAQLPDRPPAYYDLPPMD